MTLPAAGTLQVPPLAAVISYGNLALSHWAPPPHAGQAQACRMALLHALWLDGGPLLLLATRRVSADDLGHRAPDLAAVLQAVQPWPGRPPWQVLPTHLVDALGDTLLAGQLLWRERVLGDDGRARVRSHRLGLLLQSQAPDGVHRALQAVAVPGGVQRLASVISNPRALLTPAYAQPLHRLLDDDPGRLLLLWHVGGDIVALGREPALTRLHQMLGQPAAA